MNDPLQNALLEAQIVSKQDIVRWIAATNLGNEAPAALPMAMLMNLNAWRPSAERSLNILAERLAMEEQKQGRELPYIPCPGHGDGGRIICPIEGYDNRIPAEHQREIAFLVTTTQPSTLLVLSFDPWKPFIRDSAEEFWRKKASEQDILVPQDYVPLFGFTHLLDAILAARSKTWFTGHVTPQTKAALEEHRLNPYWETATHVYAWNATNPNTPDADHSHLQKKLSYLESFIFKKIRIVPNLLKDRFGADRKIHRDESIIADENKEIWENFLIKCIEERHSDIHVMPNADGALAIASRKSGNVRPRFLIPPSQKNTFYKTIMAGTGLDALKDPTMPKDARASLKHARLKRTVDFRYSLTPGPPPACSPKIVMRILDPANLKTNVKKLATHFPGDTALWDRILRINDGTVILTGPTGSGKSMTLYALLQSWHASDPGLMFQTIEEPIEFLLGPWLHQSQTKPPNTTWASLIRQSLRNDIDGLMLGEINNPETAQLATQFSISGHILLSTIHVPSACHVPKRLKELQADPNTTATTLKCSIAQRLVALSCPNCQRPLAQDEKDICLAHGCPKCDLDKLLNNDGCQACDGEGVNGRTAIQEFAFFDTEAERKLILATDPAPIQQHMNAKGLPSLSQKAWILAAKQIIPASQALNVANCNEYPRPE